MLTFSDILTQTIRNLSEQLHERDQAIAALNQALHQHKETMHSKEKTVMDLQEQLETKEDKIKELETVHSPVTTTNDKYRNSEGNFFLIQI